MAPLPAAAGECFAVWRGAVPRFNLWDQSFSRVELDQRSREAWLRIERQVRLHIPRTTETHSLLRAARSCSERSQIQRRPAMQ